MAKRNHKGKEPEMSEAENHEVEVEAAPVAEAEVAAAPAVVEEPKADERYKLIKHPESGELVKRKDFILELWAKKVSRGDIAKKLTEITGKKVPYQIVFAATKQIAGGPDKVVEAAPAPAAEAAQTPTAE